jgi:serine/threonine protein kinase
LHTQLWSFGVILFHFLTRFTLFHEDREDHIADAQDLSHLHYWTDAFKSQKLNLISDPIGRNLVSHLLSKDPQRRPMTVEHVLQHPFFTGKQPGRMVGSKPKYDVFISYRVAADAAVAELLYNVLTQHPDPNRRLDVFWDVQCLPRARPWKSEFCKGLIDSSLFVPIISRAAVKNAAVPWQNFEALTASSDCDNVLLEHRFAHELSARQLLDGVFPVCDITPHI